MNSVTLARMTPERREEYRLLNLARMAVARAENTKRWPLLRKFKNRCATYKVLYGLNEDDVMELLVRQHNACPGCGTGINFITASLDHIIATCNGGTNEKSNYQLLCFPCNVGKHQMAMEAYILHCAAVVKMHGEFIAKCGVA